MIDVGEIMDRINHTHNFFHFKNQKSSLDNHQSDGKNAGTVPVYAPNPNSQTAVRAVGPLIPPAPFSPAKARGRRGAKRL